MWKKEAGRHEPRGSRKGAGSRRSAGLAGSCVRLQHTYPLCASPSGAKGQAAPGAVGVSVNATGGDTNGTGGRLLR